jgi:hypothetical protein
MYGACHPGQVPQPFNLTAEAGSERRRQLSANANPSWRIMVTGDFRGHPGPLT